MSNIKTVQVTLTKAHTHAGVKHQSGAIIPVSAAEAEWLEQHRIGTVDATQTTSTPRLTTPKTLGVVNE